MNNQDYIREYKGVDAILKDYYKLRMGSKTVDVKGIVCPLVLDNRQLMAPTDNQLQTPHCAGYSAATLIESLHWKKTGKLVQLDSHQVYAKAKELDRQQQMDGTYLETAMNAVLQLCKKDKDFSFLANAKVELFYNKKNEDTIIEVKDLLHKHDFLQVGFEIDQGWMDCNNWNYVIRPRGMSCGGHAVNLCGYDGQGFYVLNQWGPQWGAKGYAIVPYDVFMKQFMYGVCLTGIAM